jgi:hypothetical protein
MLSEFSERGKKIGTLPLVQGPNNPHSSQGQFMLDNLPLLNSPTIFLSPISILVPIPTIKIACQ